MDFSAFLTSLGTSFAILVILMLLFTWLSRKPGNSVVYYPNRIWRGLDPYENGARTLNPFAWIREALSSSEEDVIAVSGVDTAVYFVFLTTGLSPLHTVKSVFSCVSERERERERLICKKIEESLKSERLLLIELLLEESSFEMEGIQASVEFTSNLCSILTEEATFSWVTILQMI
ncbi:hypothetical protein RJ639_015144 [Escallonia herrerae]|uniref:CSC1/OSCA1-like N-terminal transmembrane domain-containing protein n=1 Tax=Escallonia herrerae TaxID=1293975 RepID=A0AA88VI42_9ASTE|nr:hypothetical protein RJ639_015144 [Escallonia herrerae]